MKMKQNTINVMIKKIKIIEVRTVREHIRAYDSQKCLGQNGIPL